MDVIYFSFWLFRIGISYTIRKSDFCYTSNSHINFSSNRDKLILNLLLSLLFIIIVL